MRRGGRDLASLAALALLASCVGPSGEEPSPAPTPAPENAVAAGLREGPAVRDLRLTVSDAEAALASFRESCPKLLVRTDASGLTRTEDWRASCAAAADWPRGEGQRFFESQFETVVVGDGTSFVTGYFEPEILGSRTPRIVHGQAVTGLQQVAGHMPTHVAGPDESQSRALVVRHQYSHRR